MLLISLESEYFASAVTAEYASAHHSKDEVNSDTLKNYSEYKYRTAYPYKTTAHRRTNAPPATLQRLCDRKRF